MGGLETMTTSARDKVFVITGSGQGLGKAFALRLLEAGAKVCLSDLTMDLGAKALEETTERFGKEKVCLVACDVTKVEQFANLLDEAEKYFGVECVDVTLIGVMTGTEVAMNRMRGKVGCQIINTASMASFGPMDEPGVGYSMSKYGVLGLTRSMAKDITKHGVTFKCINPAWTDTDIVNKAEVGKTSVAEGVKEMGGMMTPAYVAEGFFRLVTQCDNGTALAVLKGCLYMEIPEYNKPLILGMALLAKIATFISEPSVIQAKHYVLTFLALFFLLLVFV